VDSGASKVRVIPTDNLTAPAARQAEPPAAPPVSVIAAPAPMHSPVAEAAEPAERPTEVIGGRAVREYDVPVHTEPTKRRRVIVRQPDRHTAVH
jgi:hypothetical protein